MGKKMYRHSKILFSHEGGNLVILATQMNLEDIMLTEVTQNRIETSKDLMYVWSVKYLNL